ncbi:hypothetical protein ISS04_00840 [Candidatus Woesearchaeota archaeon]|nr:hypothetical protein [Candidatus Woesearchaeota archaeon]
MESLSKDVNVDVLQKIKKGILTGNVNNLKKITQTALNNASIFQDETSISIAIISYAIYKLIERKRFVEIEIPISIYRDIIKSLENSSLSISNNNQKRLKQNLRVLFESINKLDGRLPIYIGEILEKAKVKKAYMIHEKGISLARAAELMGTSQWELMHYIGKTRISEHISKKIDVKTRLNFTRGLFGL